MFCKFMFTQKKTLYSKENVNIKAKKKRKTGNWTKKKQFPQNENSSFI